MLNTNSDTLRRVVQADPNLQPRSSAVSFTYSDGDMIFKWLLFLDVGSGFHCLRSLLLKLDEDPCASFYCDIKWQSNATLSTLKGR